MSLPVLFLVFELCWLAAIVVAAAFEKQIAVILRYVAFWRWKYDAESESAMSVVAEFAGLAIAQLVAFAVYLLRDPTVRLDVGALYLVSNLIPMTGLGFLVWGHRKMNNELIHRSNVQTAWCAFIVLLLSAGVMSYSLVAYSAQQFPTQVTPKALELTGADVHKYDTDSPEYKVSRGDLGVAAIFEFRAPSMPDPLVIPLTDLDGLPEGWHVVNAVGYVLAEEQPPKETSSIPVIDDSEVGKTTIYWRGLEPLLKYRLVVLLHPGQSKAAPSEVAMIVKAGKALTAKAYLRDQL